MSNINESLSDLLDDQCSSVDLDNLLKDDDVIARWHRYNTVSLILKNEHSVNAQIDFCQNISQLIAKEPAIIATQSSSGGNERAPSIEDTGSEAAKTTTAEIFKFGGGMAIAASIAVMTFFSFQTMTVSSSLLENEQSAQSQEHNLVPSQLIAKDVYPLNTPESIEQMELESLNDIFMEKARRSELDSIAPFATNVGGEYVKTIRLSARQWQQILQKAADRKAEAVK